MKNAQAYGFLIERDRRERASDVYAEYSCACSRCNAYPSVVGAAAALGFLDRHEGCSDKWVPWIKWLGNTPRKPTDGTIFRGELDDEPYTPPMSQEQRDNERLFPKLPDSKPFNPIHYLNEIRKRGVK